MHNEHTDWPYRDVDCRSYRKSVRPRSDAEKLADAKRILRQHARDKHDAAVALLAQELDEELNEIDRLIP